MTRDEVVTEARCYVEKRTAWRHMGRSETGIDCVGLLVMIAKRFKLPYKDYPENYRREPDGKLLPHLRSQLQPARLPLKPAMIVLLRDDPRPCHVGIYALRSNQPSLVHACAMTGRVIEEPFMAWANKFTCAMEFPQIQD